LACSLNFEIGHAFADAAEALLRKADVSAKKLAAVASHGQTIYHIPPQEATRGSTMASTLQLGEPATIALRLGVPTIANFRAADMVMGGQGAPLVPFADFHLFAREEETLVIHNIGGIANSTVLPAGGTLADILAFDTGPGNVLIDLFVSCLFPPMRYDAEGQIAARGRVIRPLLEAWMALPFIDQLPPKSTGREMFGPPLVEQALRHYSRSRPEDFVATATRFTARSFLVNLQKFVVPKHAVHKIYLAGGGAKNATLRDHIAEELESAFGASAPVLADVDELGVPSKARECVAFAVLGFARLHRIPANVPSATGASRPVVLGVVYEP
jgi:anhydro-N-acetylmuramic acid kinase